MDQARAVTLVYRANQADPRGTLTLDVRAPVGSTTPDQFSVRLKDSSGNWVTFTNGSEEIFWQGTTGWRRLGVQFDVTSSSEVAGSYTAFVRSWSGSIYKEETVDVRVLIPNERGSHFGLGWSIAGLQRLHFVSGSDDVVITEGDGSVAYFEAVNDSTWSSPDGDFTRLTKSSSTDEYSRSYRGGSTVVFDNTGLMVRVEDEAGNTTDYGYDGTDRLTSITDPAGKTITLSYGGDGKLASIEGPNGRTSTITIDGSGDLTQIDDPANGTSLQATYDSDHRLLERVDRGGGSWSFAYDFAGKLAADTMPSVTVDGSSTRPVTEFRSIESEVLVDPSSGQGTSSSPATSVASSQVEAWVENAEGERTEFRLDRFGAALRVEQPLGRTLTFDRNSDGQVTEAVGPRNDTTEYRWQGPDGRLSQLDIVVDDRTIHVDYDTMFTGGISTKHVHGDVTERWTFIWGDAQVDSVRVGSASAAATEYQYDGNGRVTKIIDPMGHERELFYASSGYMNQDSVIDYKDRVTSFTYDGFGRLETVTNPLGHTTEMVYDDLNRVVHRIDAQSDTVTYTYGDLYLTSVEDPKGQQYDYTRNALGWLTQRTDPRNESAAYEYDAVGRRTSWTSRAGATVTYQYDALGNLTSRTAGGQSATYSTDPDGWWTAASNSASTDTIFFDGAGRVEQRVSVQDGHRYVVGSTYGEDGRRTELRIEEPASAADTVRYIYNEFGQLDTLVDYSGGEMTRSFNADRQVIEHAYPGNDTLYISYDSISHERVGYSYSRSALSDSMTNSVLRDQVHQPKLQVTPANDSSNWREYQHDPTGQLVEWSDVEWTPPNCELWGCTPGGTEPVYTETYSYDAAGNRTDANATIANGNRLTDFDGYSMSWDDAGRLTSKTGNGLSQDFHWGATGRLDSVETDGQMVRYEYNAFGQRVEKDGPSGTTGYVWDGSSLIATTNGSGAVTAKFSYLPGIDKPHSMRRDGTTYYYGLDHLGGVWGMFEGGGPVANTYHYDPWGNVQNAHESVENPLQFTGREWDAGPGLLYLRNRYYDPSIARFISQDPIGLSGGINPYVYAANSPVLFSDPLGLDDCDKDAAASNKEDACEVSGVGVTVSNRSLLAAFQPSHLSTTGATPGGPKAAGLGGSGGGGESRATRNGDPDEPAACSGENFRGHIIEEATEGPLGAASAAAAGAVAGGIVGAAGGGVAGGIAVSGLAVVSGPVAPVVEWSGIVTGSAAGAAAGSALGANVGAATGFAAGGLWGATRAGAECFLSELF